MAGKGRKPAASAPVAKAPVTSKAPVPPKAAASKAVAAKAPAKVVAKPAPKQPAVTAAAKPVEAPAPKVALPESAPVAPAAPELAVETAAAAPAIAMAAPPEVKLPEPPVPELVKIVEAPAVALASAATIQKEVITMEATIKNATDKAQTLFADANERAKAAVEKSTKLFEEANEFSKGNLEAIVESGKIAAKGIETLGQDAAEYSRKQFEGASAALKSLASVKSPTDFFKLHSDYVRSAFDSVVAQTSKNTEAMLKLAGEVAQPISNRVAVAAEKVKIAA